MSAAFSRGKEQGCETDGCSEASCALSLPPSTPFKVPEERDKSVQNSKALQALQCGEPAKRRRLLGKQQGFLSLSQLSSDPGAARTKAGFGLSQASRLGSVGSEEPDVGAAEAAEDGGLLPEPWVCPVCSAHIKVKEISLSASKRHHWVSRHPELPLERIQVGEPIEVCASELLPLEARSWSCPVKGCKAGLPPLAFQPFKRAKRKHAKTHGLTLRDLFVLGATGAPKQGTSKALSAAHDKKRQERFATHTLVQVDTVERREGGERGTAWYCSVCFSKLGKTTQAHELLTCQERLERLQTNGFCLSKKRGTFRKQSLFMRRTSSKQLLALSNTSMTSSRSVVKLTVA